MKDVLGNPLASGDRVAVAMREGNQASIRVGTIKSIEPVTQYGQTVEYALVEWEAVGLSYTKPQSKATRVTLPPSRVVKI